MECELSPAVTIAYIDDIHVPMQGKSSAAKGGAGSTLTMGLASIILMFCKLLMPEWWNW
jgi:hypothetical protein